MRLIGNFGVLLPMTTLNLNNKVSLIQASTESPRQGLGGLCICAVMNIRPFTVNDRAAVIELHEELQRYEQAFRNTRALGRQVSEKQVQEYEQSLSDKDEQAFLMIAEADDRLIGYVFFIAETEILEKESGQIYVQDIMVAERYRKKGIGSALMDSVRGVMGELGVRQIDLQVLVGNEPAKLFYKRQGFETAYLGLKTIVD